ncbi:hypothetical protein ACFVY4_26985 [Streptomyces sp. NPDC058299]|uniref:hypothetical protein n=1 Tax=Streptomyces sp. NPDC058299 TaxID=3346435 RepID=UPI0036E6F9FC
MNADWARELGSALAYTGCVVLVAAGPLIAPSPPRGTTRSWARSHAQARNLARSTRDGRTTRVRHPSTAAALFFTISAIVAVTEMLYTGLYLPYPWFPAVIGVIACLLTALATTEWTALRTRRHSTAPRS